MQGCVTILDNHKGNGTSPPVVTDFCCCPLFYRFPSIHGLTFASSELFRRSSNLKSSFVKARLLLQKPLCFSSILRTSIVNRVELSSLMHLRRTRCATSTMSGSKGSFSMSIIAHLYSLGQDDIYMSDLIQSRHPCCGMRRLAMLTSSRGSLWSSPTGSLCRRLAEVSPWKSCTQSFRALQRMEETDLWTTRFRESLSKHVSEPLHRRLACACSVCCVTPSQADTPYLQ